MINAIGIICANIDSQPDERALAYLQASYLYGVEAYCFSLNEVNRYQREKQIRAFTWENGALAEVMTDLPKFTEIYFGKPKEYEQEYTWLEQNTVMTDEPGLTKLRLQNEMLRSDLYPYSIPTYMIKSPTELLPLLPHIPKAILKPSGGRKGLGVMRLNTSEGRTEYSMHGIKGVLTQSVLDHYFADMEKDGITLMLLEPFLNILNQEGKAFDFRCIVSMNGEGNWENVLTYARIGGTNITSNFSDGGSLNFAEEVLEGLIPDCAEEKLLEINSVALATARLVRERSRASVSYLGIDICIEMDQQQIYVIEANSKPGTKLVGPWPLAKLRAQYFRFLLSQPT